MDVPAAQFPDSLSARLQACGVRPTAQRLRVAAMLLTRPQHMTAEQLAAALRSDGCRISKATVYNTLNLFAAQGVIRGVDRQTVRRLPGYGGEQLSSGMTWRFDSALGH